MLSASIRCQPINDIVWLRPDVCQLGGRAAVFRVKLAEFESLLPDLYDLLLPTEKERAGRYHHVRDQQRFIIVRGVLKSLLGMYVNQAPAMIQFEVDSTKKPRLKGFPKIHFNVSHSGDWALVAIAGKPIGTDVEKVDEKFDFQTIMPHSFSLPEQAYIGVDHRYFYQLWTRKEALLKATAKGIDDQLPRVPALDGHHDVTSDLIGQPGNWFVADFRVANDHQGAVAYLLAADLLQPDFFYLDQNWITRQLMSQNL